MLRNYKEFKHSTAHRITLLAMAQRYDWRLFIEVGVRLAGTGAFLLGNKLDLNYRGVDPFVLPSGTHAEDGYTDYGKPDMEDWFAASKRNLAPYGNRGSLQRVTSADGAALTPNGTADCVFIDADHRTENVLTDIDAWLPVVSTGGWLIGHDWNWPSVRAAVRQRFTKPKLMKGNLWGVRA